jgi:FkbH-like protein
MTRRSLVVVDLDPLAAEDGAVSDPRFSAYTKAHLTPALLGRYARDVGHLARQLAGRVKKVLALDLDGTVWGGVLGDDGPRGVEVGDGYRGAAFASFQLVVKQLAAQGVLLAVASKNDPEPVREALRTHPGMVLREDDLVRISASWGPKPDALRDLATALNLAPDSLVFADDSAFECDLVRQTLPDVAVVQLDDDPAGHPDSLLLDGWFDTRELSDDDLIRPQRYREESERAEFLRSSASLDEYLRELRVRVTFEPATTADVPRLAQLTSRTNQFNLTRQRLQPQDVQGRIAGPATGVLAIRSADRFGDNGLVGAVFVTRAGDRLMIDNFLLSCRVFARGIEQACISALLRQAGADGVRTVVGAYRPHARNAGVSGLYPQWGFKPLGDDGTTRTYGHDLTGIVPVPGHVDLDASRIAGGDGDH